MKALTLTTQQEKKLLEMCKTLWPDLDFRITSPVYCKLKTVQSGRKKLNHYENETPWYEFCMIWLCPRIGNFMALTYIEDYHMFQSKKHLVDIIYQEFKNSRK